MNYWQISQFSKEVGKHPNTVDGWFKDLETQKIHFVNRNEKGAKVYDEHDLTIAEFIKKKRDVEGFTLQATYNAVGEELQEYLRLQIVKNDGKNEVADLTSFEKLLTLAREQAAQEMQTQGLQELKQQLETFAHSMKDQFEKDAVLTAQELQEELYSEAEELWYQKPEKERTTKIALLFRIEDQSKKTQFIRNYVNSHFKQRVENKYTNVEDVM